MKSQSLNLENIYIDSIGLIVSKKEKEGPLGKYFKDYIEDYYFECKTFEKAQARLTKAAIAKALEKSMYKTKDIQIAIGGDLSNQIFCSTSSIKEEYFPYVGIYAACASGILAIILASIYMMASKNENALAYTSSHVCVSQRQFRYPNEYGCIKKQTCTNTVTGATAIVLSNKKNSVMVRKATIGKVVDVLSKNVDDMGTCMAFAAFDTLKTHLENNQEKVSDYDLIITGDLGETGSDVFNQLLSKDNIQLNEKYFDCGNIIYYKKKQQEQSGGSGPNCVMAVTFSFVISMMKKKKYKKVIVIATGALHSQISYQQKESIPCIAHAIVLEAC